MPLLEFHRGAPAPPPVKPESRPVEPGWTCKRSGDCCRKVTEVAMTQQEAALLQEWADANLTIKELSAIRWQGHQNPQFVILEAGPCPFLRNGNECAVHPIRPFNCRRFGCLRPDPPSEPLQMAPLTPYVKYGEIGCSNLRDRLVHSRVARRIYELLQRKGQRWALKHGWSGHETHF